ncbi:MAG: type II secretion system F family protein [Candidatus Dormibacteria bacterium]
MTALLTSPVTFYVLAAMAFAMLCVIGVVGADVDLGAEASFLRPQRGLLDHERERAASIGMPWQRWVALRVALLVVGGLIGYWSQLPVIAMLAVASAFGLPMWVVRYRASKLVLKQTEGAKQRMQQIVSQVSQSRIPVDEALRRMAQDPPKALADILSPLRSSEDLRDALVEVAEKAGTPEMEQITMQLVLARSRDPKTMLNSIEEVVIPRLDGDLALDRNLDKLMSGTRWNTIMMVAITGALFLIFDSAQSFHAFYASVGGQLSLMAAILIVSGMVALLNLLTRPPTRVRWAVRRLVEMEGG